MKQNLTIAASLTDVSKSFGGKLVMDRLSLSVRVGEVTALLGPNGGQVDYRRPDHRAAATRC